VLRGIWQEMKALNGRIDGVRSDLTAVRTELKAEISTLRAEARAEDEALRHRLTESEIRVSTAVSDLAGETRALASLIPRVA
jgi:outer membrane murein-binding lipoprotein Lpp